VDARSPAQDKRVVLIEDDAALLAALTFAFEVDGYEVEAFATGEAALASDLANAACLVVDYWLTDSNGLDLLEQLRADGGRAPAILITSPPTAIVRDRADSMGVAVIEKPLLSDELVDAVRRMTRRPASPATVDRAQ
jgi:FixJ family two-component response regulator